MQEGRTVPVIPVYRAHTLTKISAAERRYRSSFAADRFEDALKALDEVLAALAPLDLNTARYHLGDALYRKAVVLERLGRSAEANAVLRKTRGKLDELARFAQLATFYYRHRTNRALALKYCKRGLDAFRSIKKKDEADRYYQRQIKYVFRATKATK